VFKAEKQEVIDRLRERFQGSSSVICVDFRGVNVEKITQFRRQLRQVSGDYRVVKNTLTKRAIKETSFKEIDQFLVGPTGVVFCPGEPMEPAKIVTRFVEETNGALQIKGGVVDGTVCDAQDIRKVATLPSRQELLAQFVGALQSPIVGLVGTLEGIIREFVYTLQAIADKQTNSEQ
jgi:large subunit ribosomal protein L10